MPLLFGCSAMELSEPSFPLLSLYLCGRFLFPFLLFILAFLLSCTKIYRRSFALPFIPCLTLPSPTLAMQIHSHSHSRFLKRL